MRRGPSRALSAPAGGSGLRAAAAVSAVRERVPGAAPGLSGWFEPALGAAPRRLRRAWLPGGGSGTDAARRRAGVAAGEEGERPGLRALEQQPWGSLGAPPRFELVCGVGDRGAWGGDWGGGGSTDAKGARPGTPSASLSRSPPRTAPAVPRAGLALPLVWGRGCAAPLLQAGVRGRRARGREEAASLSLRVSWAAAQSPGGKLYPEAARGASSVGRPAAAAGGREAGGRRLLDGGAAPQPVDPPHRPRCPAGVAAGLPGSARDVLGCHRCGPEQEWHVTVFALGVSAGLEQESR